MAKTNETTINNSEALWGTSEELLLACAVNRYGARSWDSVAVEIQKRCSGPPIRYLITPKNCEQKYLDLKRRFTAGDDDGGTETIPWLEELKKLRMAELKLELERYDLSIVSLQLKVKRLKEERHGSEDLEKKTEFKREPDKLSPELIAGKSNQSSNSTDVKGDNNVQTTTVTVKLEREAELVRAVELNREPDISKPNREGSCNGSSDSIAKERVLALVKSERGAGESPELESVAESGGRAGKENSDVQSSVSKLKKEGNDPVLRGSSVGDEPENEDDQSPATKAISVKSQPLVDLLEIVRSHKLGSVFTSRLISQESTKYKNLVRQHLDLEILQKRLDEGLYSDGTLKFRRDLLVIINNALIFFKKNSSEHAAATVIRQLVTKHMARINSVANSSKNEKVGPRPNLPLPYKKTSSDSLLIKPKIPAPVIFCKKRSSISSKKKDERAVLTEEKNEKQPVDKSEENQALKKRTRDGFSTGSRNIKKTGKNPNNNSEESSDHKKKNPKNPKNPNMADVKKQGAANFLSRIKKSSPSDIMPSIDTSNDNKKSSNNNKRSFGGKQQKEEKERPKSVTGRPPKRAAAQPPLPVSGKRSREAEAAAKQPKKKTRK